MAKAKDILLDDDMDLKFENGDFVIGESDAQHIEHILIAAPGDYRQFPLLGFNIRQYLKGPESQTGRFVRNLKVQLEDLDG